MAGSLSTADWVRRSLATAALIDDRIEVQLAVDPDANYQDFVAAYAMMRGSGLRAVSLVDDRSPL